MTPPPPFPDCELGREGGAYRKSIFRFISLFSFRDTHLTPLGGRKRRKSQEEVEEEIGQTMEEGEDSSSFILAASIEVFQQNSRNLKGC